MNKVPLGFFLRRWFLPVSVPLLVLFLPSSVFPVQGLTVLQHRVIAIFLMAALCWIFEPIPIFATSILVIAMELVFLSDRGLIFFQQGAGNDTFGQLIRAKDIIATLASPIILLFLGGFFLAIAASKYRLDHNLARVLLRPFGHSLRGLILGLMIVCATFSMFMSNTATTAMMLAILGPLMASIPKGSKGRIALTLSIPTAANVGGIGTPIGTPPNAIALRYLTGKDTITFAEWMLFGVPFVVVMILISWLVICALFSIKDEEVHLSLEGEFLKTPRAIVVYLTFAGTIVLWLTGSLHGMDSYTVAALPITIFLITGVINKSDLSKVSWDVLWLVSGGFALGLGLESTGLAQLLVSSIPFSQYSPYLVLVGAALLCLLMANFMSHTATANLLLPIMAALGSTMTSFASLGGSTMLILAVTFAASLGMSLPISTPPNALAHATGEITSAEMAKVGVVLGLLGMILTFITLWLLHLLR